MLALKDKIIGKVPDRAKIALLAGVTTLASMAGGCAATRSHGISQQRVAAPPVSVMDYKQGVESTGGGGKAAVKSALDLSLDSGHAIAFMYIPSHIDPKPGGANINDIVNNTMRGVFRAGAGDVGTWKGRNGLENVMGFIIWKDRGQIVGMELERFIEVDPNATYIKPRGIFINDQNYWRWRLQGVEAYATRFAQSMSAPNASASGILVLDMNNANIQMNPVNVYRSNRFYFAFDRSPYYNWRGGGPTIISYSTFQDIGDAVLSEGMIPIIAKPGNQNQDKEIRQQEVRNAVDWFLANMAEAITIINENAIKSQRGEPGPGYNRQVLPRSNNVPVGSPHIDDVPRSQGPQDRQLAPSTGRDKKVESIFDTIRRNRQRGG